MLAKRNVDTHLSKFGGDDTLVLPNSVEFFIPSEVIGKSDPALQTAFVQIIALQFSKFFGGANVVNSTSGYWASAERGVVVEPITIVQSNCDDASLDAALPAIGYLGELVKDTMLQDAVSIRVNGTLYII